MRDKFDEISSEAKLGLDRLGSLLSSIIDSSHDAIVSKTLDGIITSWNPTAEVMFGYTAHEAIGKSIRLIIPSDRQAEEDYVLAQIRRGEKVDHFETVRQTKDCRRIDISLTVSPIRDARGLVVGASKIARNISERKKLERERETLLEREKTAHEQLNGALRARDEFIAVAAHEFRNPLNALLLTLQVMQLTCHDPQKASQIPNIAEKLRSQLHRFAALVDRLLDVARARAGNFGLYRENFDLAALITEVSGRFKAENPAVSISLELEPKIEGTWDRLRLDQVVTNLISNAIKYGTQKPILINALIHEQHAVIRVRDEGIGISPENLPRVFDSFERVTPDSKGKGLGIGLWITKRIVEEHGGAVLAESELGKGSTFIVQLPLHA